MPSRLRKTCTSALALFMGLWLSGGHWMLLQVTAWSGMMVTRTVEMGVGEALETTFSGESPCALCMAVQAGQEKENSSVPQQTKDGGKLKLEVTLSGGIVALVPPPPLAQAHAQEMTPAVVTSQPEPPVPPPRVLA
ncbi:hypothetical protein AYO49_05105 [Verrucomicrobiaceae bacterium SCGC AG-212-N21]|nr:hypothetical protein AYO49_05105 [Verrucomicrobiaceae bacterium SCGC AG-212-N21]